MKEENKELITPFGIAQNFIEQMKNFGLTDEQIFITINSAYKQLITAEANNKGNPVLKREIPYVMICGECTEGLNKSNHFEKGICVHCRKKIKNQKQLKIKNKECPFFFRTRVLFLNYEKNVLGVGGFVFGAKLLYAKKM